MTKQVPSELLRDHESRQVSTRPSHAMPSGPPDNESVHVYRHYFGQAFGAIVGNMTMPVDIEAASVAVEEAGKLARLAVQTERLNMGKITK